MKNVFLYIITLCLLIFPSVSAEELNFNGYSFDCYDSSRGLPQSQVVAFAQNSDGYMFIAGRNSFMRFDGRNFVFPKQEELDSIPTNRVNDVVVDSEGFAYLATDAGLWTVDKKWVGDEDLPAVNVKEIGFYAISSLTIKRSSDIVYGTVRGRGVFAYTRNGVYEFFSPENQRLNTRNVNGIFVDRRGWVWLGADNGVYLLDDGKFIKIEGVDGFIGAFSDGPEGSVLAGGKDGIFRISGKEAEPVLPGDGFPYNDVTALLYDERGDLWIGTEYSGLLLYNGVSLMKLPALPDNRLKMIRAFAEDGEGNIWIGTLSDGFCIAKKNIYSGSVLRNDLIKTVSSDYESEGNIWLYGVDSGLVKIQRDGTQIPFGKFGSEVISVFVDSLDTVWIATRSDGLFAMSGNDGFKPASELFESSSGIFPISPSVIFEDKDGNVWTNDRKRSYSAFKFRRSGNVELVALPQEDSDVVDIAQRGENMLFATEHNGVFIMTPEGSIESLSLWNKQVFMKSLFVDSKGRVWFVTASDGIFIVIEKDVIALPAKTELPSGSVYSIIEDFNGNFWMSTTIGVARLQGTDIECLLNGNCSAVPVVLYDRTDGMASSECFGFGKPSLEITDEGKLLVPTRKGLAFFDTKSMPDADIPLKVSLDWAEVSGKNGSRRFSLAGIDEITLLPGDENISLFYSVPFFGKPGEVFFDYSFDGTDLVGTAERSVSFSDIREGNHEFSVRAYLSGSNKNGLKERKIRITVPAVFYKSTGFKWLIALFFILAAAAVYFMNRRLSIRREIEVQRRINEKTAELQLKNSTLQDAVMKDPLTGLMNRRFLFDVEERKIRRFIESLDRKRHLMDNRSLYEKIAVDKVYSVMMMDIDHFKRVNDIYGHDTGDIVLTGIAEILKESVRADDILIRWGGEEFLIVLKDIPKSKSYEIAKTIRKSIEKHPFVTKDGTTVWVTASMGVVSLPLFASAPKLLTFENILTLSDKALYYSKENGRDKATVIVPGSRMPKDENEVNEMLSLGGDASVNEFFTFKDIKPDNFGEFDM